MTPGETIKYQREKRGWSQTDLARETALSTSTINRYERDKRALTIEAVHVIAMSLSTDEESYRRLSADLVQTTCNHFGTMRWKRSSSSLDGSVTESGKKNPAANKEG